MEGMNCDEITFDIIFLNLENLQSSKVWREKGRKEYVEISFSIFSIEVWKSLKNYKFYFVNLLIYEFLR